ncbi:MAG: hypothetical protein ACFB3T_14490 [Geminicoccaceae bacterium]
MPDKHRRASAKGPTPRPIAVLILTQGLPVLIAALVSLGTLGLGLRSRQTGPRLLLLALAMPLGMGAAYVTLFGVPSWPPPSSITRIPIAGLIAGALGAGFVAAGAELTRAPARWLAAATAALIGAAYVTRIPLGRMASLDVADLLVLALVIIAPAPLCARPFSESAVRLWLATALILATGLAVLATALPSFALATLCLALAAGLLSTLIVQRLATGVGSIVLPGLIAMLAGLAGYLIKFTAIDLVPVALASGVCATPWLAERIAPRGGAWVHGVLVIGLSVVLLAAAVQFTRL